MANYEKFFVRGFIKFLNKQIQEVQNINFHIYSKIAYHSVFSRNLRNKQKAWKLLFSAWNHVSISLTKTSQTP
jgi:hypothetical protein